VISFVCLDGIIEKTNKRCILVTLSSATLDKGPLCRVSGQEQPAEKQHLGTGKASLPSALALKLGKEPDKGPAGGTFAKCSLVDTQQSGNFFTECFR
jgi:hypothetical protein